MSIQEFLRSMRKERGVDISMEIMEHIPKGDGDAAGGHVRDREGLKRKADLHHRSGSQPDGRRIFENIRIMGRVSKVHLTNKKGTKLHTDPGR